MPTARLMTDEGISGSPSLTPDGALIGIVTRTDLVRAFARTDPEIEREIRDIVLRTLWMERPGLHVRVERSEVALVRKVAASKRVELLEALAARVPGVVTVRSTDGHGTTRRRPGDEARVQSTARGR